MSTPWHLQIGETTLLGTDVRDGEEKNCRASAAGRDALSWDRILEQKNTGPHRGGQEKKRGHFQTVLHSGLTGTFSPHYSTSVLNNYSLWKKPISLRRTVLVLTVHTVFRLSCQIILQDKGPWLTLAHYGSAPGAIVRSPKLYLGGGAERATQGLYLCDWSGFIHTPSMCCARRDKKNNNSVLLHFVSYLC